MRYQPYPKTLNLAVVTRVKLSIGLNRLNFAGLEKKLQSERFDFVHLKLDYLSICDSLP